MVQCPASPCAPTSSGKQPDALQGGMMNSIFKPRKSFDSCWMSCIRSRPMTNEVAPNHVVSMTTVGNPVMREDINKAIESARLAKPPLPPELFDALTMMGEL